MPDTASLFVWDRVAAALGQYQQQAAACTQPILTQTQGVGPLPTSCFFFFKFLACKAA